MDLAWRRLPKLDFSHSDMANLTRLNRDIETSTKSEKLNKNQHKRLAPKNCRQNAGLKLRPEFMRYNLSINALTSHAERSSISSRAVLQGRHSTPYVRKTVFSS
jgi:hypothetical protein